MICVSDYSYGYRNTSHDQFYEKTQTTRKESHMTRLILIVDNSRDVVKLRKFVREIPLYESVEKRFLRRRKYLR